MPNFDIETAIIISFILGVILPMVGIGGIISLIIIGFTATYLTRPEITSYKVGGGATGIFSIFFFFFGFITPPKLPYILPNPLSLGVLVAFSGILNLIFSLIVSIIIYGGFGLLGGFLAEKFFMGEKEKKQRFNQNKPRRTLKRA